MEREKRKSKAQKNKEDGTIVVRANDLSVGLEELSNLHSDPSSLKNIHIILPNLGFLFSLFKFDFNNPSVATILDAWSIGITSKITVHTNVIKLLSPELIIDMPIVWTDQKGTPVIIHHSSILNYSDVALLDKCYVLAPIGVLTTSLSKEHMDKNNIRIIKRQGSYVSS
jgi:microcompartment protein PduM